MTLQQSPPHDIPRNRRTIFLLLGGEGRDEGERSNHFQREGAKTRKRREKPRRRRSADFQVCCIADFQIRRRNNIGRPADLEVGDTAGLETGATFAPLR